MTIQLLNGEIEANFKPATYCDSSFILDFISFPLNEIFPQSNSAKNRIDNFEPILRKYWKSDKRVYSLKKIIEKIYNLENKTCLVYSPLVTLECIEKIVENNFLNTIKEQYSIKSIQKEGRKKIGDALKKLYDDYQVDDKLDNVENFLEILVFNIFETGFGNIDDALSLFEIVPIDLINLSVYHSSKEFEKFIYLSQFQIGLADILHLIAAHIAGCEYFVTFDTDFVKVKDNIKDFFGIEILHTIDDIYETI